MALFIGDKNNNNIDSVEPWRIIVLTDGRPSSENGFAALEFPCSVSLNVVCVASPRDYEHDFYQRLTSKFHGNFYPLHVPEVSQQIVNTTLTQVLHDHCKYIDGFIVILHDIYWG